MQTLLIRAVIARMNLTTPPHRHARGLTCATKVRYFADTHSLLIEFLDSPVTETRDLDENTVLDADAKGNICSITVEHASQRAGAPQFAYEQIAA
jgi:uncharacterized protein YuzE